MSMAEIVKLVVPSPTDIVYELEDGHVWMNGFPLIVTDPLTYGDGVTCVMAVLKSVAVRPLV